MVRVEGVTKVFSSPMGRRSVVAVDAITLSVSAGEVYGLIGPNGSGKSTTMKMVLGLVEPTAGRTEIFGRDSGDFESRAEVGFLPENPYFYKHLSGFETLQFYGRLCGMRGSELRARCGELLRTVGLDGAADRRLAGYSKGMLQRIGLAAALVQRPRLVVLDEPTAGVDPAGSRGIRDLIIDMKRQGITVILASHLLEQVQEVCDRVGIIANGRLVREGPLSELTAVEDQTEVLLRNATPELLEEIHRLVDARSGEGAQVVRMGHPRTTLERLFLEATGAPSDAG